MQTLTQEQLGVDVPWMSYISDHEERNGLCRVYGYPDENGHFDALTKGNTRCGWFTSEDAQDMLGEEAEIGDIIRTWRRRMLFEARAWRSVPICMIGVWFTIRFGAVWLVSVNVATQRSGF